jgi:hypothetical protein
MGRSDGKKPAITIADDTKKKFTWNLPVGVGPLVAQYAEFYSEATGVKVSEDQVVAAAIQALAEDKVFQKWEGPRSNGTSTPASAPAAASSTTRPAGAEARRTGGGESSGTNK